jgi:CubicO group peptidase (beta-lactamase class C family)
MTKIVTATAVMKLVEGGNLDLDALADEYFRGFKVVSQPTPVTVRHLLNHSSGLANPLPIRWVRPADAPDPDRGAFVRRLLAKHRKLKSVPGERAGYSNLGYLVLGEGVSEVTGSDYEAYVRDEILLPLGMERTGFSYPEAAGEGAATGYQPLPKPLTPLLRAALPGGIVGPRRGRYVSFEPFYVKGPAYGGLVGGVDEAARFVVLHLNGGQANGAAAVRGVGGRDAEDHAEGGQAGLRARLVPLARGQRAAPRLRRAPRRRGRLLERDAHLPRGVLGRRGDGQHHGLRSRVHMRCRS